MRRSNWAALLAVPALAVALAAGCRSPTNCECPAPTATATLVMTCVGQNVTQVTLTGACENAPGGLSCLEPAAGPLVALGPNPPAGCHAVGVEAPPGTCGVTMTFANGGVFTQSFEVEEAPAPAGGCCGGAVTVTPQTVTVPCVPGGGVDAGSAEAGAESGADAGAESGAVTDAARD